MSKRSRRRDRERHMEAARRRRRLCPEARLFSRIMEGPDWFFLATIAVRPAPPRNQLVWVDGKLLDVLLPIHPHDDHAEFDRLVCRAGLKAFIRPTMPSDQPGHGTPIDPATRRPDPTIAVPDVRFPDYVIVREMAEGLRSRVGIEIVEIGMAEVPPTPAPGER